MIGLSMILPTLDQRNRIQDMARFMNSDGSSSELMNILYIFGGFLLLLLVLKGIARQQEKKETKHSHKK